MSFPSSASDPRLLCLCVGCADGGPPCLYIVEAVLGLLQAMVYNPNMEFTPQHANHFEAIRHPSGGKALTLLSGVAGKVPKP
jgi:hypothetical protein